MLVLVELSLIVNGRIHILPYGLGFTVVGGGGAHWALEYHGFFSCCVMMVTGIIVVSWLR